MSLPTRSRPALHWPLSSHRGRSVSYSTRQCPGGMDLTQSFPLPGPRSHLVQLLLPDSNEPCFLWGLLQPGSAATLSSTLRGQLVRPTRAPGSSQRRRKVTAKRGPSSVPSW